MWLGIPPLRASKQWMQSEVSKLCASDSRYDDFLRPQKTKRVPMSGFSVQDAKSCIKLSLGITKQMDESEEDGRKTNAHILKHFWLPLQFPTTTEKIIRFFIRGSPVMAQ